MKINKIDKDLGKSDLKDTLELYWNNLSLEMKCALELALKKDSHNKIDHYCIIDGGGITNLWAGIHISENQKIINILYFFLSPKVNSFAKGRAIIEFKIFLCDLVENAPQYYFLFVATDQIKKMVNRILCPPFKFGTELKNYFRYANSMESGYVFYKEREAI